MCTTDSARLSKILRQTNKSSSLLANEEDGKEQALVVTAKSNVLLVWLNYYKLCKQNFKRSLSEQDVCLKAIKGSTKQLKKKLSTTAN